MTAIVVSGMDLSSGECCRIKEFFMKKIFTILILLTVFMSGFAKTIMIPDDAKGKTVHIVLKVTDNGKPSLTSYRRIVLECR